jgi:O-antigen/teichoic acid export membrane protein
VSTRANAVANYLGQGWTTAMNLAFIPFYVSYLGMEAFGLIGVYALLQTWFSLLDFGLTPAIGREMARTSVSSGDGTQIRDLLRSVEAATVLIAIALVLGLTAASEWIAVTWLRTTELNADIVARALAIMAVVAGLRLVENIYRSSMIGLQRQVQLNAVLAITATLRGGGAVAVLAWWAPTIGAFFIWQGLIAASTVLVLAICVYRSLPAGERPARASRGSLMSVAHFAGGTVLITALGFALSQADKFILSAVVSLESFGIYSLAYTVASSVRLLAQPIDFAVYPRLAQYFFKEDGAGLARLYHKAAQYNAVLVGSAGVFLVMFGEKALELWIGDPAIVSATHGVMAVLVVGMVLNAIMNGPYYLQLAVGWTGLLVRVNSAMVVLFVPITWALTVQFGMFGAASAWLLINGVYVVVVARLMHRRVLAGEMKEWYIRDLLLPIGLATVTGAALKSTLPASGTGWGTAAMLTLAMLGILAAASLAAGWVRSEVGLNVRSLVRSW